MISEGFLRVDDSKHRNKASNGDREDWIGHVCVGVSLLLLGLNTCLQQLLFEN